MSLLGIVVVVNVHSVQVVVAVVYIGDLCAWYASALLFAISLVKPDCYAPVTVWTTAVEHFVLSSPRSRVGDKCEQYRKGHESHYLLAKV